MISIIMPVYKAHKYIYTAVESILNQSYSDIELILIDDCGNDDSIEMVKNNFNDDRIKYYYNEKNMGIAYSRNRGIELAKGEYIALMDDDDIAPLNRLKDEVEYLENHPDIDAIGGRYCAIDEDGNVLRYSDDTLQNPNYIKACLMFFDPLGNGSMLFRKRVVEENNIRFMDDCQGMEDYRFWVGFSKYGKITNLKEVMLYWRDVKNNETNRAINDRQNLRKTKFAEIQRYAILSNGFKFTNDELNFITTMLPEGRLNNTASIEDVKRLHQLLVSMAMQARDLGLDNFEEIKVACRKQLSRRLEYSEAWDI